MKNIRYKSRWLASVFLLFFLVVGLSGNVEARNPGVFAFTALTGGGTGALDKINPSDSTWQSGDRAIGMVGGKFYAYYMDTTSGEAESASAPYKIIDPDTDTGDARWILVDDYAGQDSYVEAATSAGQSISNATTTIVIFGTENEDDLGEYNNATGVFTPKKNGRYLVSAGVRLSGGTWALGNSWSLYLYKGGVNAGRLDMRYAQTGANFGAGILTGSKTIELTTSDTIDIRVYHNIGAANALSSSATDNWLTISRVP